jgi:tyrosine-protein phosphatase SIW14
MAFDLPLMEVATRTRLNRDILNNALSGRCNVRLISNLARTSAVALLVAVSLASPVAAQTGAVRSSNSAVVDISRIQIDNFGRVDLNYYRGAQPKGHDYTDLAALGVKTLINLTSDDADMHEPAMAVQAGLQYVQIPMTTHEPPTQEQLAQFLQIVTDPARQPVYVHCVGGRHRTGVMTAAYRMTQDGWTADQAFNEMKHYKFGADFLHAEFKTFVYGYHASAVHIASPAGSVAATKTGG